MNVRLKEWLAGASLIEATATEDECNAAVGKALATGALTVEKYAELIQPAVSSATSQLTAKLDTVLDGVGKLATRLEALEQRAVTPPAPTSTATNEAVAERSTFDKMFAGSPETPAGVPSVRVVGAHERYSKSRAQLRFPETSRSGVRHPFAGQPCFEGEATGNRRSIDSLSELDMAVCGAYVKWAVRAEKGGDSGIPHALRMTDHDRDLMQYALREMLWGGVIRGVGTDDDGAIGVKNERLSDWHIKAILDDVTSGGVEITPTVFDDAIVQTPLLYGEFYPRVNTVNITRGRRVEGGSIGNVTMSASTEGTAIPLFSTASFIAEFNTDIFVVAGTLEIGLDFLSDSPIDVASVITAQYGQRLLAWLDEQVCIGDGTTEPEGVLIATGTTTVNATNGAGGPPTVGDYEGLLFGVAKQFKQGYPNDRITYAASETTYRRARAIAVGTTDARRVFGMTHGDYTMFDHPFGVGGFFTNRQILFVNWGRYRMYRRLGLTVKITTEGKELVRGNLMLLSARARYGGQLELGGAAAVCTDAQA